MQILRNGSKTVRNNYQKKQALSLFRTKELISINETYLSDKKIWKIVNPLFLDEGNPIVNIEIFEMIVM